MRYGKDERKRIKHCYTRIGWATCPKHGWGSAQLECGVGVLREKVFRLERRVAGGGTMTALWVAIVRPILLGTKVCEG